MTTNEGAEEAVEVMEAEAEIEEHEEAAEEVQDTTDWKMRHDELAARLKRAETKLEKTKVEKKVETVLEKEKAELDETQLDFLDVKGITDQDEIDLIHNVMKRTGQTVRQTLRDDYVQTKLAQLRKENELKDATPGSTRRSSGGEVGSADYWFNRYEQKGELPKDFKLRSEVINRKVELSNSNKPSWH